MKRLLAPLLVTFALAGGVAYVTIPDGGGVIHACYDKQSGQARIFDPAGGAIKGCGKTESEVSWNQTGPPARQELLAPRASWGLRATRVTRATWHSRASPVPMGRS